MWNSEAVQSYLEVEELYVEKSNRLQKIHMAATPQI